MNAETFQELYKMVRGSKAAMLVFDARSLFMEKKYSESLRLLQEAREIFADSRSRTLKQTPEQQLDAKARDADRQLRKLKRKQDKTIEAMEAFDELLPQLQKLAERDQRRRDLETSREAVEPNEPNEPSDNEIVAEDESHEHEVQEDLAEQESPFARLSDLSKTVLEQLAQAQPEQQLDLINQHFGFRQVQSEKELHGEALYYVQTPKIALLVCTPPATEMDKTIRLTSIVDQRPIKPFSRSDFLKLGSDRKMVLLTRREAVTTSEAATSQDQNHSSDSYEAETPESAEPVSAEHSAPEQESAERESAEHASAEHESAEQDETQEHDVEQNVLDLGAFSQLLTSAQRSGLVPDAEQVGYVRDREFRQGKYDLAFQSIDTMYSRFMASAGQRTQRLAREDSDIAAGRVKMSPKELQAKRARDRTQTQEVERAKRRFQVVLEGLRILMNTEG